MARRLSRRKRPLRSDFMLKEHKEVEGMLDKGTMIYLSKFYNKGIIDRLGFIIARGKEADVYVAAAGNADAVKGESQVVLKFFRVETSTFFNMNDYIVGDPRFKKISSSKFEIVKTWCKKEFGNLEIARKAGVDSPKPYMFNGNILAMQYIGDGKRQAMRLKDTHLSGSEAETVLERILWDIRMLYRAKLVHADLSEYNILMYKEVPYFIDFGQAVVTRHPKAMAFLQRDMMNVLYYFRKNYRIEIDYKGAYALVTA